MKLLITGSTGFIGTHLVDRLLKNGHELCLVVRESTNLSAKEDSTTHYVFDGDVSKLIAFMEKEKFDGIIHLASLFLAAHKTEDIAGLVNSNVLFGASLLEAATRAGISWFVNTGTFWQHYENKTYAPVNLYAATKQAFEDIAAYYIATSPITFVTLKLSDTFGPNDPRPKVFNLWAKIAQSGEELDMSPGEQYIDISYIDNVIDGYERLMLLLEGDDGKELTGKSFVIKASERMTLKELAALFERVTNTSLAINWGKREYRPREVMVPWENGEIIPGWQQMVSIEEGIERTFHGK
jgi:CDP-paratose synthetase